MAWNLARYIKAALVNRWNLLAVAGGAAFAVISGHADVVLPLVAASEVAYLGFVASHPKFQNYVDYQDSRSQKPVRRQADPGQTAMRILKSLPPDQRDRFKRLRSRLLELREIARGIKRHQQLDSGGFGLESFQLEGLDRLLWVFLRLQYTKHAIARFLSRTDEQEIVDDIQRLQQRLDNLEVDEDDVEHAEKIRATLLDNLETSRARLDNYRKAEKNFRYIELELDRLEDKITSLAELGVNRQEPSFITSQVDQVASSMMDTEATMNELDFVTHLGPVEDEAPELLRDTIYIGD